MPRTKSTLAATALALTATACALVGFTGSGSATSHERPAAATAASRAGANRPNPYAFLPKVPSFRLSSTTVRNGKPLPTAQLSGVFGVPGGKDISPQLSWCGFPAGTKSFVVSMYDPEAPTGSGFWHWVVADIPASATSLPENAGALGSKSLPVGAFQLNGDAGAPRYIGGAPPAHSGVHDYYVTVTALDIPKTGLNAATSGALLGFTIDSHTLARATLVFPTAAH
jgi:Raf kinase inhibitor-like YbhB/YbcL family protein